MRDAYIVGTNECNRIFKFWTPNQRLAHNFVIVPAGIVMEIGWALFDGHCFGILLGGDVASSMHSRSWSR